MDASILLQVHRDYIPEPAAVVECGQFRWLWSPQNAFCSLRQMAGNIKRSYYLTLIMIWSYNVSLYGVVFFSRRKHGFFQPHDVSFFHHGGFASKTPIGVLPVDPAGGLT